MKKGRRRRVLPLLQLLLSQVIFLSVSFHVGVWYGNDEALIRTEHRRRAFLSIKQQIDSANDMKNHRTAVVQRIKNRTSSFRTATAWRHDNPSTTAKNTTCIATGNKTLDALHIPTFILAGAQKAGTSALYKLLRKHPSIHSSTKFEIHFFDTLPEVRTYKNFGEERICQLRMKYREYWRLDDLVNSIQQQQGERPITFEKSPVYMCQIQTAEFIKQVAPWTKILIILRDPIDRAYSAWKMASARGDGRSFDEVVAMETQRLRDCNLSSVPLLEEFRSNNITTVDDESFAFSLNMNAEVRSNRILQINKKKVVDKATRRGLFCGTVNRGFYAQQLAVWMKHFELGKALKVVRYERFLGDRNSVLADIFGFVGAPPFELSDEMLAKNFSPRTKGENKTEDIPMSDTTREYLSRLYKPHNDELADMLGEEWRDVWS